MKKVRLTIIAAILVFSSIAVTRAHYISSKNTQTWFFNGVSGEENDPSKYQSSPVTGVTCGGSGIICSITAEADGDQPLLDSEDPVSVTNPDYQPVTQRR